MSNSEHQPTSRVPELTLRVILLGLLLSVVMGAANVYVGLKAGMTVSASIPAAVMAILVFRLLPRRPSILEANQVQTCASAGESLAAGIIFTMPALVLLGIWTEFDLFTVTLVAMAGGLLGILFMIPMRKVFVVDNDELPYPEGIACAAVLKAGTKEGSEGGEAKGLLIGGLIGILFKVCQGFLGLFHGALEHATERAGRIHFIGADASPMLIAVGYIVRLNVAVLIFIGGAIAWIIGIPLLGLPEDYLGADIGGDPVKGAYALWNANIRFVGVGAMVLGGAVSIVAVRQGLVQAVKEIKSSFGSSPAELGERDLPGGIIAALVLLTVGVIAFVYERFTGSWAISGIATVIMVIGAFFFTAVASYIVGLVGNSNSPVSGMTITAMLATGGLMLLFGYTGTPGMVATLGVAAVVCCVACTSGDVCNDLKTGSLVGAEPRKQQIMQVLGVIVAAFIMAPILNLLNKFGVSAAEAATNPDLLNEFGGAIGGKAFPAPQAGLFKSLAEGLFPAENTASTLPWHLVGIGAGVGLIILVIDTVLKKRGSKFRMHLMPIAVGMYLPFGLAIPILAGGLLAHFVGRGVRSEEELEARMQPGVLFSSGVIAGEALTGIGLAGLAAFSISKLDLGIGQGLGAGITGAALFVTLILFWIYAKPRRA